MTEQAKNHEDEAVDQPDSWKRSDSHELRESYAQLGLKPGTPMRDIEKAYWRFARELRGQRNAITPYTEAYEALVNRVKPRVTESREPPVSPPTEMPERAASKPSSPGAKFGWPAT